MRAILAVGLALLAITVVPLPARAAPSCSGTFTGFPGSGSCAFDCSGPNLYFKGYTQYGGAYVTITVTAECGVVNPLTGAWTPVVSYTCTNSGPFSAYCSSSGPNTASPATLQGRCSASATGAAYFICVSGP